MVPLKKEIDGNDTQISRREVAIAIRKNSFTVKTQIHDRPGKIQAATWSLTEGRLLSAFNVIGIYISPSSKTSPREIKDFHHIKQNIPYALTTHFSATLL